MLLGLSSRPERVGQLVTLRSFDATSAEWAVTVARALDGVFWFSAGLQETRILRWFGFVGSYEHAGNLSPLHQAG